MPTERDAYANARNLAIDILRSEKTKTPELISDIASRAAAAQKLFDPAVSIDVDVLTAELRHLFSVGGGTATALDDYTDHKPWLQAKRGNISWRFWNRYVTYLERDFGMPPAVVRSLNDVTDMVLERLEDPLRAPEWDRRGMVVGSVQSGKTANYTGLICKAVDAGYKLVIVLAGIHSNLRAQTQLRIDEGVLGFDTQKNRKLDTDSRWIGVGRLPGERLVIHSLTSSAENGDFNKAVAENIGVMVGGDPVVLIVKKNSRLLDNLLKWVLHVAGTDDFQQKKRIVKNVPLLLIDDEADNASINTKAKPGADPEDSVTAINGKIRSILDAFEKSAYVGYTATPFANIFINPEAESARHGEDLFPRSFIINVKAPTNYVGPAKVFGLDGDRDAAIDPSPGLPIVKEIDDYALAFPPKHTKEHIPASLPESLKTAVQCFVLVCAARIARGQMRKHNSMLVHVTRFIDVQKHVVSLVTEELDTLRRRVQFGDGGRKPTVFDELEKLWNAEFVPVSHALGEDAGPQVTWNQVMEQLHPAASKIAVMAINGYAKEALEYKEHEMEGRSVIAIGGDKLSRGLTLEGLSISYFLRTSRMYDTLMQMGRWFGYRPGYLDLCRLFTIKTLKQWYRHIALAEEELRREFDYMVAAGLTPANYGLRVRTHPDGMMVTAVNKMSHGRTLELSWAGVLAQTTHMPKDDHVIDGNLGACERLIRALKAPVHSTERRTVVWANATAENVAGFVESLKFPPASARASGEQLARYIRKQAAKAPSELTRWTVALISNAQAAREKLRTIGGHTIGLIERNPESQTATSYALKKSNILNPVDEGRDFEGRIFDQTWYNAIATKHMLVDDLPWLETQVGQAADDVAVALTKRWQESVPPKIRKPAQGETTRANGRVLRVLRPTDSGLLLIYPLARPVKVEADPRTGTPAESTGLDADGTPIVGVALSFPTSETAVGVEYRVNPIWGSEIEEDEAYED